MFPYPETSPSGSSSGTNDAQYADPSLLANQQSTSPPPQQLHFGAVASAQKKRTIIREVDGATQEISYRAEGIPNAPPLGTDLPWHHMAGITSEELTVFFPNHALRVGAIAARFFAEGMPMTEIHRLLHLSRGLGERPPADQQLALANTIRVGLRSAEKKFLRSIGLAKSPAPRTAIEEAQWEWQANSRSQSTFLRTAWTVEQIAAEFAGDVFALPDFGPFTVAVKDAKWAQMNSLFVDDANNGLQYPPLAPQNPPVLPANWSPNMHQVFHALALFENAEAAALRAQSVKPTVTRYARRNGLADVLQKYNNDPQRIMAEAPHLIAGEVILHSMSRHGFQMTIAGLEQGIIQNMPAEAKQLHRTTFSHRFRAAIHDRALQGNCTDEQALADYQKHERFIINLNQNKRKWGSSSETQEDRPKTSKKVKTSPETAIPENLAQSAPEKPYFQAPTAYNAPYGYAPAQEDDPMDTSAFQMALFGTDGSSTHNLPPAPEVPSMDEALLDPLLRYLG